MSFVLGQLFVVHCAFSFGEKNGELYQLTTSLRKLHLLSETAYCLNNTSHSFVKGIILIGLQGSGKTTFYFDKLCMTHIHLSMDILKTRHREKILFNACLEAKQPCAIDNTNPTKAERANYINLFKLHKFKVHGYYFQSKLDECLSRNSLRSGKARIPDAGIKGTHARIELPSYLEGFDCLYYVSIVDDKFVIGEWKDEV